jgi:hypothetical protein
MPCQYTYQQELPAWLGRGFPGVMNTLQHRSRTADTVALALTLAVIGVASAVVSPVTSMLDRLPAAPSMSSPALPTSAAELPIEDVGSVRITMTVGGRVATASLADTRAGRRLAAMLPFTVDMQDPFGQAKSGPLPSALPVAGTAREFHPVTGAIYYWPDGGDLAVFYDSFGQAVPPPGLVHLGSVDTGLDAIASRGDVTVTIQQAD